MDEVGRALGDVQPAAPIETFARFQAGFLSSEDFHSFLLIFIDFHCRWIAGLAGLARLAGRFGFLALLEASLNLSLIHISEPTRPY